MSSKVEFTDLWSVSSHSGISIVGQPLSTSKQNLISRYTSKQLSEFLGTEQRTSMGDYMIVDSGRDSKTRIITSPGFSGAFYAVEGGESLISPSMSDVAYHSDRNLNQSNILNYIKNGTTKTPQFSTIFSDVYRIPPAAVCDIESNNWSIKSYLGNNSEELRLKDSLYRVGKRLDRSLSGPIHVMFSGGIDSLCLVLALKKHFDNVVPVTFDVGSRTNGPVAHQLNEELGLGVKFIDHEYPFQDTDIIGHLESRMKNRLVNPRNPHHGFTSDLVSNGIIISGQNMDAVATGDMSDPSSYIHLSDTPLHHRGFRVIRQLIENIRYIDPYINSKILRELLGIEDRIRNDRIFNSHVNGYLLGIQSTGKPNSLSNRRVDQKVDSGVWQREINAFQQSVSVESDRELIDLFRFYQYSRSCQEVISGTGTPANVPVHLPAMWGQILSTFVGAEKTGSDIFSPKRELYDVAREICGKEYRDMINPDTLYRGKQSEGESLLLKTHKEKLTPEKSYLYHELKDNGIRNSLSKILKEALTTEQSSLDRMNRILNLELLLRKSTSS